MGAAISRWRAKPSTVETLERLEKEIQTLEDYSEKYQRQLKKWIGGMLFYSSLLYLATLLVVYLWYLPEQLMGQLILASLFVLFPFLVWILRKAVVFIFSRRTEKNNEKLEELKEQKKKILEEVMETETYKNAKMILERFDPESKKQNELESTPVRSQLTPKPGQELRQRIVTPKTPTVVQSPAVGSATRPPLPSGSGRSSHSAPGGPPERGLSAVAAQQSLMRRPMTPGTPVPGIGMHPPGPPMARPILPRDRGAVDRIIEYLVGDGPQNRYALVCQQCSSHNGMALKEEFEYIAFRCAYCYFFNPARKTRPQAPRLPEITAEPRVPVAEECSSSPASGEVNQLDSGDSENPKPADAPLGADAQEPGTVTTTEPGSASDGQNAPEPQEPPPEKSDDEQDISAMEVE
ncbi:PREDICTED: protein lunapark isoform X1 [Cyprinodon variegatus]|uniref:protein lunapark isoform X1 n=1 Tax=Cyprinodon variegatus TaxID=28743 RepID=UPI000742A32B|nr:PREDICTED: protein lunapark isoform X1 [Cyprinodon variegatus]